jgi:transcriptional regulator with XRE-family HTH domain
MSTSLEQELGQRIKEARREAGFKNAEQLAVHLDVGFSTIQRWEQGKTVPSVRRIRQIAAATGKPMAHFLAGLE